MGLVYTLKVTKIGLVKFSFLIKRFLQNSTAFSKLVNEGRRVKNPQNTVNVVYGIWMYLYLY